MPRADEIQKVYEAELTLIRQQASLLLQKRSDGFSGELKTAGTLVERYVRGLITHHLPYGYRICSGYIATSETIHSAGNLLQHDAILVDCRIPSLYKFGFGDIELIPAEAVCGVFEVKKTLNEDTIQTSVEHLALIREVLETYDGGVKSKTSAANNAAGPTLSVATRSPIYAIIGLDADSSKMDQNTFPDVLARHVEDFIDLIWAPASPFLVRFAIRAEDGTVYAPLHVSRNQPAGSPHCIIDWFADEHRSRIYSTALSYIRAWVNNTSGAEMPLQKNTQYFGLI